MGGVGANQGSAASAGRAVAAYLADHPDLNAVDVALSLATSRSAFGHRAVITGTCREEMAAGLNAVAGGEAAAGVTTGAVPAGGGGRVVFVFSGHGTEWTGMGRELMTSSPVFAARLAECGQALASYTGWDLATVLAAEDGAPGLERAEVLQPVLWAVMVGLAEVWRAAGINPDAVVGHSQGEIAAACVAGILSLEDAAKVVALRSRALTGLAGRGGLISVVMPAAVVAELLEPWAGPVSVAAVNGPATPWSRGASGTGRVRGSALGPAGAALAGARQDFVAHSAQVKGLAISCERAWPMSPGTGSDPVLFHGDVPVDGRTRAGCRVLV